MDDQKPVRGDIATRFVKGQKRPEGSGMKLGQRTKRTLAIEAERDEELRLIAELSEEVQGMSPIEIAAYMGYNITVAQLRAVMNPLTSEMARVKIWDQLNRTMNPSLKSTETSTNEIKRIEIVYQSPLAGTEVIDVDHTEALPAPVEPSVVERSKTTGLQP